jgi:hypothetical protein
MLNVTVLVLSSFFQENLNFWYLVQPSIQTESMKKKQLVAPTTQPSGHSVA